jgi:2-phospho-L-lactate guanylyltransferase
MSLQVHAAVPVKTLHQAKSRLSSVLSPAERRMLVLAMLRAVVSTCCQAAPRIQTVWVVGKDAAVLEFAAQYGARALYDPTNDMNAALSLAAAAAVQSGAEALLVLPADVPLLTTADIAALLDPLQDAAPAPACVLAPDQAVSGTNALALTLPPPLPFLFGPGSFARHLEAAQRHSLQTHVYTSPTLALDIDTPADLERAIQMQSPPRRTSHVDNWLCCGT